MNAHAYERVWQESTAKNGALLVHLCLGRYANDRNVSYPGNQTLEDETRLARRSVQDGLRRLEEAGEVAELGLSEYGTRKWQLFPRDGDADSSQIARNLAPSPSSPSTEKGKGDLGAESAPPSQESAQDGLEGALDAIDAVRNVLVAACRARGVAAQAWPSREAVARIMGDFPDRDALKIAREFEFWAVHGRGKLRTIKSPAGTFRNFVKTTEPMATMEEVDRRSAYDRIAN